MALNDPLLPFQWYLGNANSVGATPTGRDLGNVAAVWQDYIGRGVRVGVFDSGVDVSHPDLAANYDARLNPTLNGGAMDPAPTLSKGAPDAHGTSVAGIISGVAANGVGIAGIAYGSRFGVALMTGERTGINLDGAVSVEQMRLMTNFDVVNHSWGPTQPFATNVSNTGDANNMAFVDTLRAAAETGRNGLGTIMVVSAGNDREGNIDAEGNGFRGVGSSNDQTLENARFMISVAAAQRNGAITDYSDPSSANLVTGFGGPSDGGPDNLNVFTADITGQAGYNNGSQRIGGQTINADYSGFNGTSAAAPTVSGVIALMLEANPRLGWRDVREILALSSNHVGAPIGGQPAGFELYTWRFNAADVWNGGGLHYSEDYGYGLVDARQAVRLAESWQGVQRSANEQSATAPAVAGGGVLPDGNAGGRSYGFTLGNAVQVETVEVTLDFRAERMRDLRVELTSPGGATSTLVRDLGDEVVAGQDKPFAFGGAFTFTSMAHMGERSGGVWTVKVSDVLTGNALSVNNVSLRVYGEALTANDVYVYNDAFGAMRALAGGDARSALVDGNGGRDTLNAAQLSTAATIDLNRGATSTLGGSTVIMGATSDIENAIGGDGADVITGNGLANLLNGMRGADRLLGGGGNDSLMGGQGSDTLDGGAGLDVALFAGAAAGSVVTREGAGLRVTTGADVDMLTDVERVRFSDRILAFDTGDGQNAGTVYRVYQAAFNRQPDLPGMSFWTNLFDNGTPLVEITRNFTISPEFRQIYGANPTNRQLVDAFYQNVLGRPGEQAGIDFWLGQLNGGTTVATALSFFTNGPENIARTAPALIGGIQLDPGAFLLA